MRALNELAEQNTFGDETNMGVGGRPVFETNLITNVLPELDSELLRDPNRGQSCGDSSRLCDDDVCAKPLISLPIS